MLRFKKNQQYTEAGIDFVSKIALNHNLMNQNQIKLWDTERFTPLIYNIDPSLVTSWCTETVTEFLVVLFLLFLAVRLHHAQMKWIMISENSFIVNLSNVTWSFLTSIILFRKCHSSLSVSVSTALLLLMLCFYDWRLSDYGHKCTWKDRKSEIYVVGRQHFLLMCVRIYSSVYFG